MLLTLKTHIKQKMNVRKETFLSNMNHTTQDKNSKGIALCNFVLFVTKLL